MSAWQQGIIQSPAVQLPVSQLTVHASFHGAVTFRGHGGLHLSGNFGESFRPLLEWTQSISLPAGTQWTVWPELVADDGVQARLRFYERRNGFSGITGTWTEENLTQPAAVSAGEGLRLAISLEARGEGTLTVGALHIRQAVPDGDAFFSGTRREADAKGEEFFSLFGSMDRKPPLNVFFTDRRPQEGFDHLDYLYSLGGCGYLGSPEYEEKITKRIRGALGTLGFNNSHLILAGNSLGAVGALYYGAVLHPRTMLLGKPLIHLGETALREKIWRPGGRPFCC